MSTTSATVVHPIIAHGTDAELHQVRNEFLFTPLELVRLRTKRSDETFQQRTYDA